MWEKVRFWTFFQSAQVTVIFSKSIQVHIAGGWFSTGPGNPLIFSSVHCETRNHYAFQQNQKTYSSQINREMESNFTFLMVFRTFGIWLFRKVVIFIHFNGRVIKWARELLHLLVSSSHGPNSQLWTRSCELHPSLPCGCQGPSSAAFSGRLAWSWIGSGAAGTKPAFPHGMPYHRELLNFLHHNSGSQIAFTVLFLEGVRQAKDILPDHVLEFFLQWRSTGFYQQEEEYCLLSV